LEEESSHVQEAREVGSNAAAERKYASEERAGGEEESDERKGEHEARLVKVRARTIQLLAGISQTARIQSLKTLTQ